MAETSQDVAKAFDAYEVIGVITPGTVVAVFLFLQWPALRDLVGDKGLSIGDFGLFIILAFVLGHLIQALGNIIELVFWLPGCAAAWKKDPLSGVIGA